MKPSEMFRKKYTIKIAKSFEKLVFIFRQNVRQALINSKIPQYFIKEEALMKKLSTFFRVENVENHLSKKPEFSRFEGCLTAKPTRYQHLVC